VKFVNASHFWTRVLESSRFVLLSRWRLSVYLWLKPSKLPFWYPILSNKEFGKCNCLFSWSTILGNNFRHFSISKTPYGVLNTFRPNFKVWGSRFYRMSITFSVEYFKCDVCKFRSILTKDMKKSLAFACLFRGKLSAYLWLNSFKLSFWYPNLSNKEFVESNCLSLLSTISSNRSLTFFYF